MSLLSFMDNREPRERMLVLGAAALIGLFILIQFILMPYLSYRSDTAAALQKAKQDYAFVAGNAPSLSTASSDAAPRQAFSRAILITKAREQELNISRVQPGSNNTVTVWFEDQSAADVFAFMRAIEGGYETTIDQAIIGRADNGVVNAQITYTTPAP